MSNASQTLQTPAAAPLWGTPRRAAVRRLRRVILSAFFTALPAAPCGAQIVVADDPVGGLLLVNEHAETLPGSAAPGADPAAPRVALDPPKQTAKPGHKLLPGAAPGVAERDRVEDRLQRLPREPLAQARRPSSAAAGRRARIEPLIVASAIRHDLPVALLVAMIHVESNFHVDAESPKGAIGPMQLMPSTARHLGVLDIRDPAANIDAGARYIKQLLKRFGNDLMAALAAYNAGPTVVARNGGQIPSFSETQRYVAKVIGQYHQQQAAGHAPTR